MFMNHKLHTFRTKFNRIKADVELAEGTQFFNFSNNHHFYSSGFYFQTFSNIHSLYELIEPRCSLEKEVQKKKQKICISYDDAGVCFEVKTSFGGTKTVFQPLYLLSDWVEPGTTTKRLTVSVLLPSGVSAVELLCVYTMTVSHYAWS